ncbi:DNA polymerase III subunit delta [Pasteuria penetrans]|uniref:DNA polymerase III subunit delta n=1 Tax=Pasteuria penetrans TaxID=86005 RepID=UPI000FC00CBB|nr:DNA polymerase III subunit delta [Pasteuria penetrans]
MEKVWASLQQGKVEPVYFFYGTEAFLLRKTVEWIMRVLSQGGSVDRTVFDLEEEPLQAAIQGVSTPSLLSERRLVWAKRAHCFTSARVKRGSPDHKVEALEAYWNHCIPGNVFICSVLSDALDKRKKIVKKLLSSVCVARFVPFEGEKMRRWLRKQFRQRGVEIEPGALDVLLLRAGSAMELLCQECQKLVTFSRGIGRGITVSDVELLVPLALSDQVFQFMDHLVGGREGDAWKTWRFMRQQGVDVFFLLALWVRQVRLLLLAKRLGQVAVLAREARLPFHVAKQTITHARALSMDQLHRWLREALMTEESIKTGRLPQEMAIERALLYVVFSR